jgi:hypothetical protein
MNFTKEQTDALKKTLDTALKSIVGQECAFVLVFTPGDRGHTVCTTNVALSDALDLAKDLVAELQRCKGSAPASPTAH